MIDRDRLASIGVITQPHGVRGALKVTPLTDTPDFYRGVSSLILDTAAGLRAFEVQEIRNGTGHWILTLRGVKDRDEADTLRGAAVMLDESQLRPLAAGEYFRHDLVGCRVESLQGQRLGNVTEVMETGANDVLVVAGEGESLLVPMVADVVKGVDLTEKVIRIDAIPGLLDEIEET